MTKFVPESQQSGYYYHRNEHHYEVIIYLRLTRLNGIF